MIGPATNTRVEVGLNVKGLKATNRLEQLPAGQMCQYKVKVTDVKQVDKELIGWIKQAYESSKTLLVSDAHRLYGEIVRQSFTL